MANLPPKLRRWRFVAFFGLIVLAAPLIVGAKNGAVLGFFNYWEFLFLLVLVALLGFVGFIAALPEERRRPMAINLSLSLVASFLAIGLVEGALFFIPIKHQMDNPWYVFAGGGVSGADEELPYGRPAHLYWEGLSRGDLAITNNEDDPYARQLVFKTDMEGFRNHTDIETADIVVIGDSFTEAGNMPEEESFVARLSAKLRVPVRNLGRAGYSPPTELIVLNRYGLKNQPKTVVWQISESNDLQESAGHYYWLSSGRPKFFGKMLSGYTSWARRSPTHRLWLLLRSEPDPVGGRFHDRDGKWHGMRFKTLPSSNQIVAGHTGWETFSSSFQAGYELCQERDIRLVVLLIPMKYRVMGPATELNATTQRELAELPSLSADHHIVPRLAELCAERDITFVDPTATLSASAKAGELVYLPFDTHLSGRGHELVAEALAEVLNGHDEPEVSVAPGPEPDDT